MMQNTSTKSGGSDSRGDALRRKNCLILFLHASGGNGAEIREFLERAPIELMQHRSFCDVIMRSDPTSAPFSFFSCEMMTPTALMRPYSPFGGERATVWHDRQADFQEAGVECIEDVKGINAAVDRIASLIKEKSLELQIDNIIVGGFSMGGGMALQFMRKAVIEKIGMTGKLLAVFSIGSYLSNAALAFQGGKDTLCDVPLLMMHGQNDKLIHMEWGKATGTNFLLSEANVRFHSYPRAMHEITPEMLEDLVEFIIGALNSEITAEQIDIFAHKRLNELATKVANSKSEDFEDDDDDDDSEDVGNSSLSASTKKLSINSQSSTSSKNSSKSSNSNSNKAPTIHRNERQLPFYFEKITDGSAPADTYKISFIASPELVDVLSSRSVLYGGASFDISPDPLNKAQVISFANTPSPEYTGSEISKRLFIRLQSDSASVNPCPLS